MKRWLLALIFIPALAFAQNPCEDNLSEAGAAYLRLIDWGIANGRMTTDQLASVAESDVPVNPIATTAASVENMALNEAFRKIVLNIPSERWSALRADLRARLLSSRKTAAESETARFENRKVWTPTLKISTDRTFGVHRILAVLNIRDGTQIVMTEADFSREGVPHLAFIVDGVRHEIPKLPAVAAGDVLIPFARIDGRIGLFFTDRDRIFGSALVDLELNALIEVSEIAVPHKSDVFGIESGYDKDGRFYFVPKRAPTVDSQLFFPKQGLHSEKMEKADLRGKGAVRDREILDRLVRHDGLRGEGVLELELRDPGLTRILRFVKFRGDEVLQVEDLGGARFGNQSIIDSAGRMYLAHHSRSGFVFQLIVRELFNEKGLRMSLNVEGLSFKHAPRLHWLEGPDERLFLLVTTDDGIALFEPKESPLPIRHLEIDNLPLRARMFNVMFGDSHRGIIGSDEDKNILIEVLHAAEPSR